MLQVVHDVLTGANEITSRLLLRKVVTDESVEGRDGPRWIKHETTYNVVDALFAISKSLDGLAREIRDMNPRNQRSG